MAKIFSADYRNGTFIDSVNKIVGVPTSLSKLIRTEKGTALARVVNHAGVAYTTGSKSLSKFTIVAWIKQRTTDDGDRYGVSFIGTSQIIRRDLSSTTYSNYFNSEIRGLISIPITTSLNKWMQFVVTYDGVNVVSSVNNKQIVSSPSATTATLDFTSIIVGRSSSSTRYSDSDILKFDVYDDVISDKEIELDYKALLDTQITEKPVRGFELVKPTDLSYLKDTGLVAAYNFKRNGNTLVDISGNGLNINIPAGITQTKEGLNFPNAGFIGNVTSPYTLGISNAVVGGRLDFTSNFTVMVRAKANAHSDFMGFCVKGTATSGWRAYIDGENNRMRANIGNQIVSPPTTHTVFGNWNTFVYIFRPGINIGFWLNGVNLGNATVTNTNHNTTENFNIASLQNNTFSLDGEIQDIRIYNRVLTEQEIKDYHNSFIKPVILEDWSGSAVGDTI